jgi:hypothetical protein
MVPGKRHLLQGSPIAIFRTSDGNLAVATMPHRVQLRSGSVVCAVKLAGDDAGVGSQQRGLANRLVEPLRHMTNIGLTSHRPSELAQARHINPIGFRLITGRSAVASANAAEPQMQNTCSLTWER